MMTGKPSSRRKRAPDLEKGYRTDSTLSDPLDHNHFDETVMPGASVESDEFVAALLRGDQRTAMNIFQDFSDHGRKFLEAELHLVQPAMYQIGRGWRDNHISIAQEHLATATVHGLLAREFASAKLSPPNGWSIVLAGVEGNQHIIGLRMVADAFELAGWDVRCLGANTPTRSLVQFVRNMRPNVVGLSVALPQHLRSAREASASLRSELGDAGPSVLLGGLAVNELSTPATMLGAHTTGLDAKSAVEAAAQLVKQQ